MKTFSTVVVGLCFLVAGQELPAKAPFEKGQGAPARSKNSSKADKFPSFATVTSVVQKHFAATRNYRPGDLITASSVDLLFRKLQKINWVVADRKEILKLVLRDNDWLAQKWRTDDGKDFLRQCAALPEGYDRVDRWRRMPYGERQLTSLMGAPDGYKMVEYMTTTPNGKNLGDLVSHGVNGKDFNEPTGRIYTETDLLRRLKQSYDFEATRRLQIEPGPVKATEQPAEKPTASAPKPANDPPKRQLTDDPFENLPRG